MVIKGCVSCGVWERAGAAGAPGGKLCVEELSVRPQNGIQMIKRGRGLGRHGPQGCVRPWLWALGSVSSLASCVTLSKGFALHMLLFLPFWDESPVPQVVIVNGF